jgi:two-component system phosphate regulon sensor histidine kinase PhoR
MDRARFQKQLFFFLLAVLLPSAVLVVFGFVFLRQQTELSQTRAADERDAFARDIGRLLEDALNDLAVQAATTIDDGADTLRFPAGGRMLWAGTLVDQEFRPAWTHVAAPRPVGWGGLAPAVAEAQRLEYRARTPAAAARAYQRLADRSRDPRQKVVAQQGAMRTHLNAGDSLQAIVLAFAVLKTESTVQDESSIPWAYYAAGPLLAMGVDSLRDEVSTRLATDLDDPSWFSNTRTYLLEDLLAEASDSLAAAAAQSRATEAADVDRMRQAVPGILRTQSADRWFQHGDRLVGTAPADEGRHVFAIDRAGLMALIPEAQRIEALTWEGAEGEGLSLAPYLRDVLVSLREPPPATSIPRIFFIVGMVLLVGLTLFGGYLLWRDVRRETRLARLRAQFVSSVSHELRTPLTSIRMFAETLMAAEDAPAQERSRYLGIISSESERLTRMLNNVLNASRIEQGTMRYHLAKGDIRDAVSASVDAMQYAFDQESVTLEVSVPEAPVVGIHDPDAIEQAVLNLLTNALKYGGRKPVSLTLTVTQGPECRIAVQDRGAGIALEEQQKIFERFYRTESAQNQRVAGAGLGLALVSHIVKAHEGRIDIHSEPGEGSTFSIHLPLESP